MKTRLIVGIVSIAVMGCVTSKPGSNFNATSLTVNLASDSRQVFDSIPAESAMDRFEMINPQGKIISYVAFTDTDTGALVFVDHKLYGTLSHLDAQAFYICRGHTTTAYNYWAQEASDWAAGLLANSKPATEVKLNFSGKSTAQSIKEVAGSPFLKRLKSLFSIGTNPFSIFNSLQTTQSDIESSDQFNKAQKGLNLITPGISESSMAEIMKPEDVSFVSGGIVMAYPSHLVEYYVAGGVVKVIQLPSFYFLSRTNSALFYAPNTQWPLCTPLHWKEALPEIP
jgi:hypothetical protein